MGSGFSPQSLGLKLASMAMYELSSYIQGEFGSWKGRGGGRSGNQPTV